MIFCPAIMVTLPAGVTTKVSGVPATVIVWVALKQVSFEMVLTSVIFSGGPDVVLKIMSVPNDVKPPAVTVRAR